MTTNPETPTQAPDPDREIGENIANARSLDELRALLEDAYGILDAGETKLEETVDLQALPTFGGSAPEDTQDVFSWDETRLLVSTPFQSRKWTVVSR